MPGKMENFLQIAPHSLAIVLGPAEGPVGERPGAAQSAPPAQPRQLARHHIGYEIFADFKAENMQHFWNKKVTAAVAETFFLGWIDEQVLLIQGKEEHLEALREGWTRRALRPPSGFHIRCLGECGRHALVLSRPDPSFPSASRRVAASVPGSPGSPTLLQSAAGTTTEAPLGAREPAALFERGIGELPGTERREPSLSLRTAPICPREPPPVAGGAWGRPGGRRGSAGGSVVTALGVRECPPPGSAPRLECSGGRRWAGRTPGLRARGDPCRSGGSGAPGMLFLGE
ncbi:hypothetical protein P7K49_005608 [Saguinus oedipus]|uniref:Uncharacterized protein n=1 Tax=Saguinus oedipus TaxID=9490 RepID=A0ABQ9W2I9_SAGOE|nr:hypothetical protein P7K49_005608 [Saguinus oedipus]